MTDKKRNLLLPICLVVCTLVGGIIGYATAQVRPKIVADVNGEKITQQELYEAMVKGGGQQILDTLISKKIIAMEAARQNVAVSDEEIQQEMQKYYDNYGGEEGFAQAVTANGYTLDEVKDDIATNVRVRKLLEPQIAITDDDLKTYFDENRDSFARTEQVRASHILVVSLDKANEVKARLASGGDFTALAKEYSTDTQTSQNGGDLGYFTKGQMTAEFEQAAFSLPVGQVSNPVKTDYGYHIIQVVDKKAAEAPNFEANKEQIRSILLEQKIAAQYSQWMQGLYQQYTVKNYVTGNS